MNCPQLVCKECNRSWAKDLPPFLKLRKPDGSICRTCTARKKKAIKFGLSAQLALAEAQSAQRKAKWEALPPEERKRQAQEDINLLYGEEVIKVAIKIKRSVSCLYLPSMRCSHPECIKANGQAK